MTTEVELTEVKVGDTVRCVNGVAKRSAAVHEPPPTGNGEVIIDLVEKDLRERAEVGKKKYGTYLRADNGRDALMDAYQEALDLAMYLRQAMFERDRR